MKRLACWTTALLVISVVTGVGPAGASLPTGVTDVAVTQGGTAANVNGHLHPASSIKGTVKTTSGALVSGGVSAYLNGRSVATGFANNGHYEIDGLFPNKKYAVCMLGGSVFSPNTATGFLGRCYKSASFSGRVPTSATLVTPGSAGKTGVNFTVRPAAAISGKVTTSSGSAVKSAMVLAYNRSTKGIFFGFTTNQGTYTVKNLPAAARGYGVCFNPFGSTTGTGLQPRCYKNKAWGGTGVTSAGATPVSVTLGHVHSKVNQSLGRGGAIAGRITDASNGKPLSGDGVAVYTSKGRPVGFASTNANGNYVLRGLASSTGYRVCAFPTGRTTSTTATTFHGRCWKSVAWSGGRLPSGTTPVAVKAGSTHRNVNLRLKKSSTKLGSIAGTVTEKAGGHPLASAQVQLFTSGGSGVATTSTNSTGHYVFHGLRANKTGYVVCASGNGATSSGSPPATGWASRCHVDTAYNTVTLPSAAKRLPLTAGQNRTGINIGLPVGGRITGTTFRFGGSTPAPGVQVRVFLTSGRLVTSTFSGFSDGTYSIAGLTPGKYVVCFDGRQSFGTAGFLPQCYNGVAWSG